MKLILRKSPKWVPKKWKPKYEMIVLLSAKGRSNLEIADALGYTPQQISNILNTPQAKALEGEIIENLRSTTLAKLEADLDETTSRAVYNVKSVLCNEEMLNKAPLAILDRSLHFLKAVGKLKGEDHSTKIQNNIVIGTEVQKTLAEGLMKANIVKELHSAPAA